MSYLEEKSDVLNTAAALLHQKGLYPVAAHPAYYSCLQLMKHIWLHSMEKTEQELTRQQSSHKLLIRSVGEMIKKSSVANFYVFRGNILKLKKLRTDADYSNMPFDVEKSARALSLSRSIIPILKNY
ncbi:MAG: hypothetical protein LBH84_03700 [Prevotellaceae bacterium]|jgi:aspartyl/asparaginyl beta-hydroxylase (cupin superfamily)|nr:hypothetical protein [Prevotellaceae bacterium]